MRRLVPRTRQRWLGHVGRRRRIRPFPAAVLRPVVAAVAPIAACLGRWQRLLIVMEFLRAWWLVLPLGTVVSVGSTSPRCGDVGFSAALALRGPGIADRIRTGAAWLNPRCPLPGMRQRTSPSVSCCSVRPSFWHDIALRIRGDVALSERHAGSPTTSALPVYPAPRLEADPRRTCNVSQAQELSRLNSAGWVDKTAASCISRSTKRCAALQHRASRIGRSAGGDRDAPSHGAADLCCCCRLLDGRQRTCPDFAFHQHPGDQVPMDTSRCDEAGRCGATAR